MPQRHLLIATTLLVLAGFTATTFAAPQSKSIKRNTKEWSLNKGVAIQGYDPVSYFPEGGGKPLKGDKKILLKRGDVTYYFASKEHRDLFKANPERYEPAYGGWCAWAMREGSKTEIDPKTFILKNDRLFLFYNGFWGNTKESWEKKGKHELLAKLADEHWKKISSEDPRHVKLITDEKDKDEAKTDEKAKADEAVKTDATDKAGPAKDDAQADDADKVAPGPVVVPDTVKEPETDEDPESVEGPAPADDPDQADDTDGNDDPNAVDDANAPDEAPQPAEK